MTIRAISSYKRFIGLSTDTKPSGISPGSEFFEVNTGQKWIFDGNNWVEDISLIYALSQALKERT